MLWGFVKNTDIGLGQIEILLNSTKYWKWLFYIYNICILYIQIYIILYIYIIFVQVTYVKTDIYYIQNLTQNMTQEILLCSKIPML